MRGVCVSGVRAIWGTRPKGVIIRGKRGGCVRGCEGGGGGDVLIGRDVRSLFDQWGWDE